MIYFNSGRGICAGLLLGASVITSSLQAELVQYQFTGDVGSAFDTSGILTGVPNIGDPMTTTFWHSGNEFVSTSTSADLLALHITFSSPNAGAVAAGPVSFTNAFWAVDIVDASHESQKNDRITFYTYDPFRYENFASYLSVEWRGSSDQFDGYDVANNWKSLLTPSAASKFVMTCLLAPVTTASDGSRSFNLDTPAARIQGDVTALDVLPSSAAVPEASTYSIAGAIMAFGLAAWRRARRRS